MNFLWGYLEAGAVSTTKYTLHSKHPLKQSVSFSSRGYSNSFEQPAVLAQHWGKELWMLALRFPLLSCPFPFTSFYSKTCICELWMSRSALPTFLHPFSLWKVPCKQLQEWTLDGEMWKKGQCAPQNTRYIPSILENNQSLLVLEDILSIVLRSQLS